MDIIFATLGAATLFACGGISWHLLTNDDDCDASDSCDFMYVVCPLFDCRHPNVGQYGGECECGERVEIGGSE